MDADIRTLFQRLKALEGEIEERLERQREQFRYAIKSRRAVFERDVIAQHRQLKKGIVAFLRTSRLLDFVVIAPTTYALLIPFVFLDACVCVYQWICFSAWNIPRVLRRDYIIIDRHRLAYLNGIQKLNCVYCSYVNGLIAYVREIGSRTEAYWCPIKHALRSPAPHDRYNDFLAYGDARGFIAGAEGYRANLRLLTSGASQPGIADAAGLGRSGRHNQVCDGSTCKEG